ncbi:MAG: hypothetical protein ACKVOW_00060 [Chitinophagaceae bacterium]
MRKIILICLMFWVCCSQAQLLKKIKEKAKEVVGTKKTESTDTPGSNNNSEETQGSENKIEGKWQPTPDAVKLFTLEKDETFLYDETKVTVNNGRLIYSFVVMNSKYKYFLIEEGKRMGPYNEPPLNLMRIKSDKNDNEGSGSSEDDQEKIELGGSNKDPVAQQYSKTINNKLYIVFNGKNFGPYDFVAKMNISPDKKKFWAAVVIGGANDMMAKMGMGNSFLVNEAGLKQKGGEQSSMLIKMMVSSNFEAAAIGVMDNSAQKAFFISSAGKTQEGNMMDLFSDNKSTMMLADNGDIISILSQSPTQLMVNGTEAASFKVPITSLQRLFIMPDYKKSFYYQKGKLYRGDGTEESLKGILFPKIVSLNSETAVYYYKIHVTDTGDKDVYVCKKVI